MKQFLKDYGAIIAFLTMIIGASISFGQMQSNINTNKEAIKYNQDRYEIIVEKMYKNVKEIDTKMDNILSTMSVNHSRVNSRLAVIEYKLDIKDDK